jgi:orotidine-5'-phosphate decarboxylase
MERTGRSLCVALDGSDRGWILDTAALLADRVGWLKIGLEAFTAHGPVLIGEVAELGCPVFLDLKLHDIPATVRAAASNAVASGARMVTVHAAGGRSMIEAAVEGVRSREVSGPVTVLAVTVLTSLDSRDLEELGLPPDPAELVPRWATLARGCGADGVVASAREVPLLRTACGQDLLIVTPGIRPMWHGSDDQRRTVTPQEATRLGADILVVGRPITRAPSPREAAARVLSEMAGSE